jgi:hypothetical protein
MAVPDGYAGALALTLAIEVPVYWGGLGLRGLAAGVVGNLITHPLIFIVLPVPAIVGEPIAWLIEVVIAAVFVRGERRVERRFEDVVTIVLAANALSLIVGAVVRAF